MTTCSSNNSLACLSVALLALAALSSAACAALLAPSASCNFKAYSAWSFSNCCSSSSKRVLEDELRKPRPREYAPMARPSPKA